MKKLLALLLAAVMVFCFAACGGEKTNTDAEPTATTDEVKTPENPVIRMATTTSVDNSGLLQYLLPYFTEATGYTVEYQAKGTGQAIQLAKDGNADLILVHAKASEEAFIEEGYGVERVPFMYNYFVIVGPADDPAGIADCATAAEAFTKIAESEATFVSRGDDSGTHKAELKLWAEAPDAETDEWYVSSGSGMGATLTMASEMGAYCLTDKATYLSMADELDLELVIEESDDMMNIYSVIACNPDKLDGLNTEGANAFITWIISPEASALIEKFGVEEYGEALFFLRQ